MKNGKEGFAVIIGLVYLALIVAGIGGWIANIVKITACNFSPIGAEVVLRVVGVFVAPLGAILGYCPHF